MTDGPVEHSGQGNIGISSRRILIVAPHHAIGYTGGRYHAWMMTEALAAGGADVVAWTTAQPFLMRDFLTYPSHGRIELHIDPDFVRPPEGPFDVIFLTPNQSMDWGPYVAAVSTARKLAAPLVFLDFEAPTWFNAENANQRSILRTAPFWASSRYADVILSSTAYGSERAREYYRPYRPAEAFRYCYLSINSIVADSVEAERANQIVCIARLDGANRHKGITALRDVFSDDIAGFTFVVIGTMPEETESQLREIANARGIKFVRKSGLTDREKFEEIKKSRLMVFLSTFEGFGLPPVEALYCGTPCIVNPLPVLKEVSGDALIYLEGGSSDLTQCVMKAIARTEPLVPTAERERIARMVRFESYVARLDDLLGNLKMRKDKPVAACARGAAGIRFVAGMRQRCKMDLPFCPELDPCGAAVSQPVSGLQTSQDGAIAARLARPVRHRTRSHSPRFATERSSRD